MANQYYPKGAEKTFRAEVDYLNSTLRAALVPAGYTFSAAHEFLSDLGATVGTAQALLNRSVVGGVFDADDLDYGILAPGQTVKALVLFKDTGNASTSPLLVYLDEGLGLPFSTNGGALRIEFPDTPVRIISLVSG